MEVSKNIRTIRERLGLTQQDLANRLNTERSNYARLESRDLNLTIKQVEEIASALGVSIFEILDTPKESDFTPDQSELIHKLQERVKTTEELLKSKRKEIKFYQQVLLWIKDKFEQEFSSMKFIAAGFLEIEFTEDWQEIYEKKFQALPKEELKRVGDNLFESDLTQFLMQFLVESGFVGDKWLIDAYKRSQRKKGNKASATEAINYIKSTFEFMNEDD
ncbi:helix-turn-helix transcriptional regulator [Dyadobacter sp. LHD-138]|uniref:helix-turn-helix domain-containing protein n=1 Tax=Dyadobacter sp. LHD-138 TaxID=3071413 RepID=UPI0027DF3E10|nr:helix-turn-helix transcriptional regulator [Dyadobacter sp. LHD-138]MDQ6482358.1 helix-turn-helix transcriptional regulator [Dyadobacter sp. LHD-138]